MRHELHSEIEIGASPQVVWDVLTDLGAYPQWNPFITEARGEVEVGARLTNRLEPPGGRAMTFRPVITAAEPANTLEWLGRFGVPGVFDGRHRFELVETPSGGTRLVHTEHFRGALVRMLRTSLDTSTLDGFEAMNEALKARAEAVASVSA